MTLIARSARRARIVLISGVCLAGALPPAAFAGGSPSQLPGPPRPCYHGGQRYEHGDLLTGSEGRSRCYDGRWIARFYA